MSTRFVLPDWLPSQPESPTAPPSPVDDHHVEDLVNRFIAGKQAALFEAPDAFYRREGGEAVDGAPAVAERLQAMRGALLKQAVDDRARAALAPRLDAHVDDALDGIGRHVDAQRLVHQRQTLAERQRLIRRAVELEPDNDERIVGLADAHASTGRELARLDGVAAGSPEEADRLTAARSLILREAIEHRIGDNRPDRAITLYDRVKDTLSPADRRTLDLPIGIAADEAATDAWLARETAARDAGGGPLRDRLALDDTLSDRHRLILRSKIDARDSAEESQRFATVKGLDDAVDAATAALATEPGRYRPGTFAQLAIAYDKAGAPEQADATRRLAQRERYLQLFTQIGPAAQQNHLAGLTGPERTTAEAIVRHQQDAFATDPYTAGTALYPEVGPPRPAEDTEGRLRQARMIEARRGQEIPRTSTAAEVVALPVNDRQPSFLQDRAIWTDGTPDTSQPRRDNLEHVDARPDENQSPSSGALPAGESSRSSQSPGPNSVPDGPSMGHNAKLPDGSFIPNPFPGPRNPTGFVTTAHDDLQEVAAVGRRDGERFRELRKEVSYNYADLFLVSKFMENIGTGGRYDHQRRGNFLTGFEQLRQFRPIANINVGLYCQQFGLSLDETLYLAGLYARHFSSNADPSTQSGLEKQTEHFIREGYKIGQSNIFKAGDTDKPK